MKGMMLSCGYQLVSIGQYAVKCCCLRAWVYSVNWVQGWGSYAVVLLVSPMVSLMIAKFITLSERWFVVDLFLSFLLILLSTVLSIYYGQAMWTLQFYVYVAKWPHMLKQSIPSHFSLTRPGNETSVNHEKVISEGLYFSQCFNFCALPPPIPSSIL